jgi:hypothetical protein
VCQRSSTACVTCRHFRRSVAAKLGYCGLDRQRVPLVGDEIRACWEAGGPAATLTIAAAVDPAPMPRPRDFVEVVDPAPVSARRRNRRKADAAAELEPVTAASEPLGSPAEPRWSLWDDPAP